MLYQHRKIKKSPAISDKGQLGGNDMKQEQGRSTGDIFIITQNDKKSKF